ncbi:MAG: bacteriocin immunity protein [Streptococcaceae bacterium]|nr:bacteriocin immunity protein [Streptococcaceae bacterium]MCL2681069.1 bacteriocin immunity protein [Streptococcaceae bacterium]
MLTDRQQKFYNTINSLFSSNIEITKREKARLTTAKEKLDSNQNFKEVIHTLMVDLHYVRSAAQMKNETLSPQVENFYNQLIETYGKPVDEYAQKAMAIAGAKFYADDSGNQHHESVIASPFSIINFLAWVLLTIILCVSLFAFPWLKSVLGLTGIIIFYIIGLSLVFIGLTRKRTPNKRDG